MLQLQTGGMPAQVPLRQSESARQALPPPHLSHWVPPQSMSVSSMSLARLAQVAGSHSSFWALHSMLKQSVATLQAAPSGHEGHAPPPQSTSVSAPSQNLSS